jgi:aromatase
MSQMQQREVEHETTVAAPADAVYERLADVAHWPVLFPPTIHATRVELDGDRERIRIWATANGQIKQWTSARILQPRQRSIHFRQEVSAPPVAAMSGRWIIEPISASRSRVRLQHHYRAVDDDPQSLAWIDAAVDENSRTELAALRTALVLDNEAADSRLLSFEDTVRIDGTAQDAYDFLNEAKLWPERLPHVDQVLLQEDVPGLQILTMDTLTKDGSTHSTTSIRVCFAPERIVYKQIVLPVLMRLHTGRWTIVAGRTGIEVSSQHTVVINTDTISTVFGPQGTLEQARELVRSSLSANSLATLHQAKVFAERRTGR